MKRKELQPGVRVKWNDPDGELCSKEGTIEHVAFVSDMVQLTFTDGNYLECLLQELEHVPTN